MKRHHSSTLNLMVIDSHHPRWQEAIDYIALRYCEAFSAHVNHFMPRFMALSDDEKILAVCGIRSGNEGELFLEQYLDDNVETVLSQVFSSHITRDKLIEFGQLASFTQGMSTEHFYLMASTLVEQGFEWCIFTATDPLFRLMKRLGLTPTIITEADPNRIYNAKQVWGTYYEHHPRILAGNLKQGLARLHAIHLSAYLQPDNTSEVQSR